MKKFLIGNVGCSAQDDEINMTLKFKNGDYPVGGIVQNYTDKDVYVKITKITEE